MSKLKDFRLQIFKFEMYGFLKNLRFFEPYLIIFLTDRSLNFFQIGLLISIREIIIYLFEVPSGVIADMYGKKVELTFCFMFYILSFIIFFFATSFWLFAIAMMLFGLGEAFRSGTHKSMIMTFLDYNNIGDSKTKVYGQTRAMSLIGSMVMSIISVIFVVSLPELRYLFLLTIIPYLLDMMLILTYPSYLNQRQVVHFSFKEFLKQNITNIKYSFSTKNVRKLIFDESLFQAGFKSIKDYIQPIIIALSVGFIVFKGFTEQENLKIYLGIIYAVIYLISSLASRYTYKLARRVNHFKYVNAMWLITGLIALMLSLYLNNIFVIFGSFILIYIFFNLRKPVMVEEIGNETDKTKRATVLSVESQLTSLLLIVFAPLIGFLADRSMQLMFVFVGITMLGIYLFNHFYNFKTVQSR